MASESEDVEFLRETYQGKEVIVIGEDTHPDTTSTVPSPTEPFRFLDLPAEMRCHIYSFVLPSNMVITFERPELELDPGWVVRGLSKGEDASKVIGGKDWVDGRKHAKAETQLFLVSKFVSNECQGKVAI
jgi:hypothetical protein